MKKKILLYDIEVSPNVSYTWQGKYDQTVIEFQKEWELLSVAWKWLDGKTVKCITRKDYPNDTTDKSLAKDFLKVLNEADITVTQNGIAFDAKKLNTRFIVHGLNPPSPNKAVDTLRIARKYFKFNSNKLNDLGRVLGVGQKIQHNGFQLWLDCMAGKRAAWRKMIKYNKRDVLLLQKVYLKLLPWINNHPNVASIDKPDSCPKCGHHSLANKGVVSNSVSTYRRYLCRKCKGYCKARTAEKTDRPKYVGIS